MSIFDLNCQPFKKDTQSVDGTSVSKDGKFDPSFRYRPRNERTRVPKRFPSGGRVSNAVPPVTKSPRYDEGQGAALVQRTAPWDLIKISWSQQLNSEASPPRLAFDVRGG